MRRHLIPFGVDTQNYLEPSQQAASRQALGIARDDLVLFFRATDSKYKGLDAIIEALQLHAPHVPTTLLTVDKAGLIEVLRDDYTLIDYGWVRDRGLYAQILNASDVLLMPSTAEAFGLMALEAMVAGRPVISFNGTAVPQVTGAPDVGISVPMGDTAALRAAIDRLALDADERSRRGAASRALALSHYSLEQHVTAYEALYREILAR